MNETLDNTILSMNETFIDDENLYDIANPAKIRPTLTAVKSQIPPSSSQQTVVQKQQQQTQQQQPLSSQTHAQQSQQQQQQSQQRTTNNVKFNTPNNNNNNNIDDDEEFDDEEGDEYDEEDDDGSASVLSQITAQSNESQKLDLLMKLDDLRANGHIVRNFNLSSHTVEIKKEVHCLQCGIELKSSIKFQQKMLMAVVSALEYGNKTLNPLSVDLDGWSENVFENIEDFNNVFERLYDKYKRRGEMAPEIELLLTLAGSAFMFNMTRQLFKNIPQPLHQLQQVVRNAYNESQRQQQQQPQAQAQTQPVRQQQSQQQQPNIFETFSSVFNSLGNNPPHVPPRIIPEMTTYNTTRNNTSDNNNNATVNTVRQTQLHNFQNDEKDENDEDRFSVASSSESIVDPTENVSHVINTNTQQNNTRPTTSFRGGRGRSASRRGNGRGRGSSTLNRAVRELVI